MKIKTPIKRSYNHEFFPRIGNYINIKFSQKLQWEIGQLARVYFFLVSNLTLSKAQWIDDKWYGKIYPTKLSVELVTTYKNCTIPVPRETKNVQNCCKWLIQIKTYNLNVWTTAKNGESWDNFYDRGSTKWNNRNHKFQTCFKHFFCLNVDFYVSRILSMPQTYSN